MISSNLIPTEIRSAIEIKPTAAKIADLLEPSTKKLNQEPEESGVKLNDLPALPFEKILSYLSLADRIRCRAVSRIWCMMINSFRIKTLCFSESGAFCCFGDYQRVKGTFVQNFISSPRFESFLNLFCQSILFSLKYLRLCDLLIGPKDFEVFARAIDSFGQLKELEIIHFGDQCASSGIDLELNLPMLQIIHLEDSWKIKKLTLNAPKLQKVKLVACSLFLDNGHGQSVESLLIWYTSINTDIPSVKLNQFKEVSLHRQFPNNRFNVPIQSRTAKGNPFAF